MRRLEWGMLLLVGCISAQDSRILAAQTALNLVTDSVDPAYEATRRGCDAADQAALLLAAQREISLEELSERIALSRARCDDVFALYERLIGLQVAARAALEKAQSGDEEALREAEQLLLMMQDLWRGRTP
jgi:hypothetical protein